MPCPRCFGAFWNRTIPLYALMDVPAGAVAVNRGTSTFCGGVTTSRESPSSQRSCRWYRAAAWSTISREAVVESPPDARVGFWWLNVVNVLRASSWETRWLISMIRLERVSGERKSSWWSGISRRLLVLYVSSFCLRVRGGIFRSGRERERERERERKSKNTY